MFKKPTYEELEQRVTELTRTRAEVRKKEHYFRNLIYDLHEDILVIDREYRITDINNTALQTMGLTRDEAVGRHCYEVSHRLSEPCHSHGEECGLQHVFETGEACNLHHEHVDADGNRFYADILTSPLRDEDGNITHVIETVRDVTDLFEAQRKVMESEERFRTVVEQSPVAIEIYEPNGRLLSVNDAWAKFWDLEKEAVADFNILDDPECERTRLTSAFKEAQQGITKILSDLHYDAEESGLTGGRKRWISPKMYPILDQEKKVKHIVLTYDDITERKQAEEERKILQIQLSQAQKMEAIGTLAGGIAHNFNNVLMGIQGRVSLMIVDKDPSHPDYEHLNGIEESVRIAAELTRDLLGFARDQVCAGEFGQAEDFGVEGTDIPAGNVQISADGHQADQRPGGIKIIHRLFDGVAPLNCSRTRMRVESCSFSDQIRRDPRHL